VESFTSVSGSVLFMFSSLIVLELIYCRYKYIVRSRNDVVGITTGYRLDDGGVGVRVPVRSRIFVFSTLPRPVLGPTQPPIQWVPGALSPGVKRQAREADHSSPASAEVKRRLIYTSTSLYAFMTQCLIC
jgi:hypothetical protein